jgi:hypothetical protein
MNYKSSHRSTGAFVKSNTLSIINMNLHINEQEIYRIILTIFNGFKGAKFWIKMPLNPSP